MFEEVYFKYLNAKLNKIYSKNFYLNGRNPKGVFWNSDFNQIKRIEELLDLILKFPKGKKKLNIADVGCGYGAMYFFIKNKIKFKDILYQGIDINQNLINDCNSIFKDDSNFFIGDRPIHCVDYCIMSGTYNYTPTRKIKTWENYILLNLVNCLKMSKKGIVFNLQYSYPAKIKNNIFYADPESIKNKISEKVEININYFQSLYFPKDVIFYLLKK